MRKMESCNKALVCRKAQPGMDMGLFETGNGQPRRLSDAVRGAGPFQPLRAGLDDLGQGKQRAGTTAHGRSVRVIGSSPDN